MDCIYGLPYHRQPHPVVPRADPGLRNDQGLGHDHARLFWWLHVLLHHCSSRARDPVAQRTVRSWGRSARWPSSTDFQGSRQRHRVDPPPTCTGCSARARRVEAICRRQSCVHPTICKLLGTDHGPLIQLMRQVTQVPGVKKVRVSSGIRMDLARRSPEYVRELVRHHVGGYLKVAPEHTDASVLRQDAETQCR